MELLDPANFGNSSIVFTLKSEDKHTEINLPNALIPKISLLAKYQGAPIKHTRYTEEMGVVAQFLVIRRKRSNSDGESE